MAPGSGHQRISSRIRTIIASMVCSLAVVCPGVAIADPSWLILDVSTGKVLGENKGYTAHGPASLAKMMTVYLTFEALKEGRLHWNDTIVVSKNAASEIPLKLWLKPGSTITVREAVNGMVVHSANDAATAIGEHLGKTEAGFGMQMTQRARQLGMKNTVFRNPWGMTEKGQYTTAYDMALLAVALMRDFPEEYPLFSQRSFVFRGKVIKGHNNLMYRYAGVDGLKTGYTDDSGFNLVSSLAENNRRIIGVVLGGTTGRSRDDKMADLLAQYSPLASGSKDYSNAVVASNRSKGLENPAIVTAVPIPQFAQRPAYPVQSAATVAALIDESLIEQGDGGVMPLVTATKWNIQIGAAPTRAGADRLLGKADDIVQSLLPTAKGYIEPSTKSGKPVYRVRFGGFGDARAAKGACAELKRHALACIPVRM